MPQFIKKLRLIFIPYLFITIATVITYTFLHWLLFIQNDFISLDEDVINFWIPFAFPIIPVLIWLRPKIKLLDLKVKKGDPLGAYIFIAMFSMIAPVLIAQNYLETATGKLTPLNKIGEIVQLPKTKYYTVKSLVVDKHLLRAKTTYGISGKHNENFDMYIHVAVPLFDSVNKIHKLIDHNYINIQTLKRSKSLILLDGKVISKDSLNKINPDDIKSVYFLNERVATSIYGSIGKYGAGLMTSLNSSNKQLPTVKLDLYAATYPKAWLGISFEKSINNSLSSAEKEAGYKEFANSCQQQFDVQRLDKFQYLERYPVGKDLKRFTKAIKSKGIIDNSIPIIVLKPVYEPFEARNGNTFNWIFGSFGIGAFVFLIALLFRPLKKIEEETTVAIEKQEDKSSNLDMLRIFMPREGYFITPILIDLNLFVFMLMVFNGLGFLTFEASDLLKWGGNYRPFIQNGEYWRLFTNIFLHGGLMHVLFNMYGLLYIGTILEPIIGSKRFALFYLITGLIASAASIWWHPATVSIGASGAIFGIFGLFFALLSTKIFPQEFNKAFLISTASFIGINLLYGLSGGIDNAAHIGGLFSGLICGYAIYPILKKEFDERQANDPSLNDGANLND
jgi:membrane associated rhomboid family serine protease